MGRRWHDGVNRQSMVHIALSDDELEAAIKDCKMLGFPFTPKGRPSVLYWRWLVVERGAGHMLHLDEATLNFARVIGEALGATAGQVVAKAEREYLESI